MKKYLIDRVDLMKEWDYEKNANLNPAVITIGTHLKAWWKCEKGHSWEALVSNRARLGRSCPYCSHQLPIVGETDLLSLYPEVCKELHPAKNGNMDPSKTMPGTHKEAWFICPDCGFEYKTRIYNRVKGIGCPVCANKKIVPGVNDFASKYPDLMKEWDFKKNKDVSPYDIPSSCETEVWWKCPIGHEYLAKVRSRASGRKCPICLKAKGTSFPEQAIFYYVKKYFPEAINGYRDIFSHSMELDIFIPSIKVGIEYDGLAWHKTKTNIERDKRKYSICEKNGIYLIRVREAEYEEETKTCDLLLILGDTRDSKYLNKEIYHVLTVITSISPKYVSNTIAGFDMQSQQRKLQFGFELMNVDVERDRRDIQQYLVDFENSLAKHRPDLIKEWDYEKNKPLTPNNVMLNCNEKVWWKCSVCGHEWQTTVAERGGHDKTNCPICALKIGAKKHHEFVLKQKGSIAETHPHLLAKWDYSKNTVKPEEVVAGSGEKAWWKCQKCGYSWQTTICHMSARDSKCPCCQNKVCVPGINDIKTLYPNLMVDWDYEKNAIDPSKNTVAGKEAFWKCHSCGHEWSSRIYNRIKGVGCPNCARLRRIGNTFAKKKKE